MTEPVELSIKSEAKKGQQHQKWLFAVSEISKIGIGFISIFLLKARVLYLTILKRKSLSLPLKVDTYQFVICHLCLPVKIFTLGQWSESWRHWCRVSFSIVLSLFLPHLRTLAQEKRSEICLRFGISEPGLCLYPLLSRNIIFSPALTMAAARKKKFSG